MHLVLSEQPLPLQIAAISCLAVFSLCFVCFFFGIISLIIKADIFKHDPFHRDFILGNRQAYGFHIFGKMMREPKYRRTRYVVFGAMFGCATCLAALFLMIWTYGSR